MSGRREHWVHQAIQSFGPVALSIGIGLLFAGVIAQILGVAPLRFYEALFADTLGSLYGVSQVLFRATPLIFTGLAVALAFQARLFNIGAEGQMVVGGLTMAWAGYALPAMPFPLGAILALAFGALGGGLWGAIPGVLRAKTGSHEVIVTILLNFVAFALVNYALVSGLALPETVRTMEIHPGAQLPRVSEFGWVDGLRGSPLNAAFLVAIAAAVVLHYWLRNSRPGFSLRILGEGSRQAQYAGLSVDRLIILAMSLSGALAGIAGASFVLGYKRYFEEGFTGGTGFLGIAVALLARNRPLAVIPSALFFGLLSYGGLVVNRLVPRELLGVVQALILLAFIVLDQRFRRLSDRPRSAGGGATPTSTPTPSEGGAA